MKRTILFLLALSAVVPVSAKVRPAVYRVSFPSRDNAVVIGDVPEWAKGAAVFCDGREIPSQLDDLDGDGRFEELAFVYEGLPDGFRGEAAGERPAEAEFRVIYYPEERTADYPVRVNAQMWLKNPDKSLREVTAAESDKDDMYRRLHHHGPAFESEFAAYRVYFDKKQSIDTYGKKRPGLELRETMWYPTDEQLRAGSGHDNLRVFGSISLGALKGWDARKQRMVHITEMKRREARIRAAGPVRTVVDMRVEGWRYGGRELNMTSRYILYAGHQDVQAEHRIEGDCRDLLFTTGVMKIRDGFTATLRDSVLVSTGCDYPENDSVRWERERMALVTVVPGRQIASRIDDAASHLVQLRPDAEGRIDCRFWAFWRKNGWLRSEDWETGAGVASLGDWASCLSRPRVERLK